MSHSILDAIAVRIPSWARLYRSTPNPGVPCSLPDPEPKPSSENRSWIQTVSGKAFYPNDPHVSEIDIVDIAHALSLVNRFTGHSRVAYSVAEHSVRVARQIDRHMPSVRLAALLHDASEAYLADIATPVKQLPEMAEYRHMERQLQYAIWCHFGVFSDAIDNEVLIRGADLSLLAAEKRDLMAPPPMPWAPIPVPAAPDKIVPWSADLAKHQFLVEFYDLFERVQTGTWEDESAGLPDGFDGFRDGRQRAEANRQIG